MTSKLQATLPKALAEQYGIRPGDEIEWCAAGDCIRVVPPGRSRPGRPADERVKLFDEATERQRSREQASGAHPGDQAARGWTREELYERG